MNYEEKDSVMNEFKRLTLYVLKKIKGQNFLRKMDETNKGELSREVCLMYEKLFDKYPDFKSHVKRISKFRIEELKREVKDHKWKIGLSFMTELLRKNPQNKDLLSKLRLKKIPTDLRHCIWRFALANQEIEREYSSLIRNDRVLTVSQFDVNIFNECNNFITKHVSYEIFDAGMIQCMKQILSYYEKKTNRILSDYHYLLSIPLVIAFSELKFLMINPGELIGFYHRIQDTVKIFDPLVGMTAKQDEAYLNQQVSSVLEILAKYDNDLVTKITSFFGGSHSWQSPDDGHNRIQQSFALIIKKFVESLGFNLLNVDVTLFVWDQIFLKVKPSPDELYRVFCILLLCEKEELMMINRWLDFAEMIYLKGKAINLQSFMSKYTFLMEDTGLYTSTYNYTSIPVDAIKLDKIGVSHRPTLDMPENFALKNLKRYYVDPTGTLLTPQPNTDTQIITDEDRMISDQMDQIIANNVILEQSDEQLAEGRGVLVDESILKSVGGYEGGMEADI